MSNIIHTVDDEAVRLDIRIARGATWVMPVAFSNDDGTPVVFPDGTDFEFTVWRSESADQPDATGTCIALDGGVVQVALDSDTTADMSGTYWHEFVAVDATPTPPIRVPVFGGVFYVGVGVPS